MEELRKRVRLYTHTINPDIHIAIILYWSNYQKAFVLQGKPFVDAITRYCRAFESQQLERNSAYIQLWNYNHTFFHCTKNKPRQFKALLTALNFGLLDDQIEESLDGVFSKNETLNRDFFERSNDESSQHNCL